MQKRNFSLWLLIGITLIILILAAISIFYFYKPKSSTVPNQSNSSLKTHKNSKYKFTFSYPNDWVLSPIEGNEDDGTFEGRTYGDVYQFSVVDQINSDLIKKAGNLTYETPLSNSSNSYEKIKAKTDFDCNADAPCAHASCPSIVKQNEFITKNSITVLEIYPLYKVEGCPGGANDNTCKCDTTQKEVGPIYFLDVSKQSIGLLSVIEIKPEFMDASRIEADPSILKSIAESIKFY